MSVETTPGQELEHELLGGERRYTREQVAELAGVDPENARRLWRALGFADVEEDKVAFTDRDVQALTTVDGLVRRGVIDAGTQVAMTRAMGQSLARLAEWQVSAITADLASRAGFDPAIATATAHELVPVMDGLVSYVWRRHLAAAAGRVLAGGPAELTSRTTAVGFADLVGFTALTRHVSEDELAALVEQFEHTASDLITQHGGRIIKTLGDEVMFVADDPADAAQIAVALSEAASATDGLPDLRVGVAYGPVVSRLGDVYGEPVNLAARLTSIARPGSVLVDRELAAAIEAEPGWRLRRVPPRPVRGYPMLSPLRLRRAEPPASGEDFSPT